MARLSIDIGVNLGDATKQLGKLNSALIQLNTNADKLASSLKALGAIKATPQVDTKINQQVTGGGVSQPKLNPVPDIFAEYRSGAIQAGTAIEFLEKKQADLLTEAQRLKNALGSAVSGEQYQRLQNELNKTEKEINDVTRAIQAQKGPVGGAAGAYGNLTKSTNLANLSVVNFGRVLQDLPFGILGIANNINPLVEGLKQLKDEAKQSGTSVKTQLLNSLKGFGGVTLAISAVSAALSFASIGLSYWTRESKKAKEETDKFNDSLKGSIANAFETGIKLNDLVSAAQKYTNGSIEQTKALNDINSLIGENTEKIDANSLANGRAIEITKRLTDALIQRAVSETFVQEAAKKSSELFLKQQRQEEISQRLGKNGIEQARILAGEFLFGRTTLLEFTKGAQNLSKQLVGIKPDEIVRLATEFVKNEDAISDLEISIGKFATGAQAAAKKYKDAFSGILDTGRVNELEANIIRVNNEIDKLTDPLGKQRGEWKKLLIELKSYKDELSIIRGQENKSKKDKKEELTDQQKFALAVAEIRSDIENIRSKPLISDADKNIEVVNSLKNGLNKLADDFPNLFRASLFRVGGDVRQLTDELSKTELKLFSDATLKNAEEFKNALTNIQLDEDILGIDKTRESLNTSRAALKGFRKEKEDLLSKPFRLEGLPQFAKAFLDIDNNIKIASDSLAFFQEQLRQQEIAKIFKEYSDKVKGLDRDFRALSVNTRLDRFIKLKIDYDKDSLDATSRTINELIQKGVDPLDPRVIFLRLREQKLKLKLEADTESLQQVEDQVRIIKDSLLSTFEGVGEAIGTSLAEGGNTAKAIGKTLLENLGSFLQQLGKFYITSSKLIQAANTLFPLGGSLIAGVGLVALGALVKSFAAKGFAEGGFVSGPGSDKSDSIPARLSNGEFVVQARSVRKYGRGFMEMINNGSMPISNYQKNFGDLRFADGGLVARQISNAAISGTDLGLNTGGFIAETRISGQDLRLVLKRADSNYSKTT